MLSAPDGPIGPSSPCGPVGPIGPASPCGPVGPVGPASPCGPVGPGTVLSAPDGPVGPVSPCGPDGPVGPVGPVAPSKLLESICSKGTLPLRSKDATPPAVPFSVIGIYPESTVSPRVEIAVSV